MRIKKISETRTLPAQVLNSNNDSQFDTYSCDYINKMDVYSTSETKTNKVWIDGKPIYRKVIVLQTPALIGNSWTTVASASISGLNISTITDLKTLSDNNICWTGTISKISNGNLQLYNIGVSGTDWYVKTLILEYTKSS